MLLAPARSVVKSERLSAFDAFFIAYQRSANISMHLGLLVELRGPLAARDFERALDRVYARWPALFSPVRAGLTGVHTTDKSQRDRVLRRWRGEREAINAMIDPFEEPALSVHAESDGDAHRVALRVHHAMADGEGFAVIAMTFFAALAGQSYEAERPAAARPKCAWSIAEMAREKRAKDERALAGRHRMLSLACVAPGPLSTVSALLDRAAVAAIEDAAQRGGASSGLWITAAWARAVRAEIERDGEVAIEVPVSLRARDSLGDRLGNHIAPLVFYLDATQPMPRLALALRAQLRAAVARGQLDADRAMAAPGALLPYALFERVAITPSTTGNATSHVAAVRVPVSVRAMIEGAGALSLRAWRPFAPVCLKMGAALTAIQCEDQWALTVSYRDNAMSSARAQAMLDGAIRSLGVAVEPSARHA